ncbi:MAG: nucleotidyltransferase family protein, partial [Lachnospiraceae bacterium]|nr:nucleotidyltransferase family protein [Lachnospiraceae bacterium]
MKKTEDIMLQLVGRALFGVPADFDPADTDWEDLCAECMNQALTLLIWDVLTDTERSHLPEAVSSRWEQAAMLQMMSNEQLLYEQEQVIRVLSDADIPCVILKGSSSASCYPDPALRNMGDIDLLVEPEEQLAAVHALQEYGYGDVLSEDHHCHMTLSRDAFTVEVHREPNGLFLNENRESLRKIRDYLDDAVARRQYVNGLPFPADDQQAAILLLHKLEHFLTSGLGLRQMCDWAVFVEKKLDTALWETLEPLLSEFGILYFAGIITKACVDYLGLPADSAPWAAGYDS